MREKPVLRIGLIASLLMGVVFMATGDPGGEVLRELGIGVSGGA